MLFFLSLFVLLMQASAPIPSFTCWFNTFENQTKHIHLVMGYENTESQSLLIYIQQSTTGEPPKNVITPLSYNGRQPDLFQPGPHLFSFVIDDTDKILQSSTTGVITWELGTSSLSVSSVDISATNLCQRKYPNHCPTWIKNFCSDDSYCNGQESCVPNFIRQVSQEKFGMCKQPVRPLPCPDNTICDESVLGCVQPRTTEPPTDTNTPLVVDPTPIPGECAIDTDCSGKNTFCLGTSTCVNNACQFDSNYKPCGNDMVNGTLVVGLGIANVVCSDTTRLCFSYFTCSSDSDCDDHLYCTGKEVCSDGICHQDNPIRCASNNVLCTESDHCGTDGIITDEDTIVVVNSTVAPTSAPTKAPTKAPTSNSTSAPTTNSTAAPTTSPTNTSLVIFLVVFAAIFLILAIIIILFIIRAQNNRVRAQTEGSTAPSNMNSRTASMNRRI